MNRRQRKKAFKKKYGFNPPKTDQRFHAKYLAKVMDKVLDAIPDVIARACAALRRFTLTVEERTRQLTEEMRGMTEEEFIEFLETSVKDEETKALAMKMRYEEKAKELREGRGNDGA